MNPSHSKDTCLSSSATDLCVCVVFVSERPQSCIYLLVCFSHQDVDGLNLKVEAVLTSCTVAECESLTVTGSCSLLMFDFIVVGSFHLVSILPLYILFTCYRSSSLYFTEFHLSSCLCFDVCISGLVIHFVPEHGGGNGLMASWNLINKLICYYRYFTSLWNDTTLSLSHCPCHLCAPCSSLQPGDCQQRGTIQSRSRLKLEFKILH